MEDSRRLLIEVFQGVVEDLGQSNQDDILLCGKHLERLRVSSKELLRSNMKQKSDSSLLNDLDVSIDLAYTQMTNSDVSSKCWRRLYTEACILRSLASVTFPGAIADAAVLVKSISMLDRAIIIAGGEDRLEFIAALIGNIQRFYPHTTQTPSGFFDVLRPYDSSPLPTSFKEIPRLERPPSLESFQRHYSNSPFILPGYANEWPALNNHPWCSKEYLYSVSGPGRLVPVEVGSDYRSQDWTQELMSWDRFLTALDPQSSDIFYLAQHNLFMQFPALREDIIIPDYAYTSPPPPPDFPSYKPPANEDQLVLNSWLGPKGSISPAHIDPFFNVYVQIVGRKTVWLAPPSVTPSMYPINRTSSEHTHNPAANVMKPDMSNTSSLDVFLTAEALVRSRDERPHFWERVVPHAISTCLEPGDMMFMPPGWWHAMRSEDISFSVSMWF